MFSTSLYAIGKVSDDDDLILLKNLYMENWKSEMKLYQFFHPRVVSDWYDF